MNTSCGSNVSYGVDAVKTPYEAKTSNVSYGVDRLCKADTPYEAKTSNVSYGVDAVKTSCGANTSNVLCGGNTYNVSCARNSAKTPQITITPNAMNTMEVGTSRSLVISNNSVFFDASITITRKTECIYEYAERHSRSGYMYINECVSAMHNVDMEAFFKDFALLDALCDKRIKATDEQNRILSGTILDTDDCVVKYLYGTATSKTYLYAPKSGEMDKSFMFTTDCGILKPNTLSLIFGSDMWKQGKKFNIAYTNTSDESKETVISKLPTSYLTSTTKKLCVFDDTILHSTQVTQSGKDAPFSTQYFTSLLKDHNPLPCNVTGGNKVYVRGTCIQAKKSCSS